MQLLIVNNGTSHLPNLQDVLKGHQVSVISVENVKCGMDKQHDAVILSGGSKYEVEENPHLFSNEIRLLKNCRKPLLGICLGLQLIGYAYGCRIRRNKKKRQGDVKIRKLQDDPLFKGLEETMTVFERHRWSIKQNANPQKIITLARSGDGIEAIRIRNRPIWATQFHPEEGQGNDGKTVINNFLELAAQYNRVKS